MSQIQAAGWFCYKDENQYNELKSIFTDAHKLPVTFSRWKELTDKGIHEAESGGMVIVRAYAESTDEFVSFCRHHGKSLSAEGRKHFANFKAAEYLRRR
ncbi:hypothetical protein RTS15_003347 [Salmonella enterica]|nr:hypothetical protein [Salmonella enterica]ELJ4824687.1 hypothetical protein [Salmonella enterica]